jgi:hypothetical protein
MRLPCERHTLEKGVSLGTPRAHRCVISGLNPSLVDAGIHPAGITCKRGISVMVVCFTLHSPTQASKLGHGADRKVYLLCGCEMPFFVSL